MMKMDRSDMTPEQKHSVEIAIRSINDTLTELSMRYNLGISIAAYHGNDRIDNPESTCIFIHDFETGELLSISRVDKIAGCLDSDEFEMPKKEETDGTTDISSEV